jgi:hypothetical protein
MFWKRLAFFMTSPPFLRIEVSNVLGLLRVPVASRMTALKPVIQPRIHASAPSTAMRSSWPVGSNMGMLWAVLSGIGREHWSWLSACSNRRVRVWFNTKTFHDGSSLSL